MRNKFLSCFLFLSCCLADVSIAQNSASGSGMSASREAAVPVNNFTGIPSISIPLYSYSSPSGIGLNLSLDYFAGGVKVSDPPGAAGLGWSISTPGVITRSVKGIADDLPWHGYLYVPPAGNDPRTDGWKFNNGCSDAEPDVFQFNFNGRAGKFYIGKDTSFFISPLSKMKIKLVKRFVDDDLPVDEAWETTIEKFVITTEDGNQYIFSEREFQKGSLTICGPSSVSSVQEIKYCSAWYLSNIVSYAGKDTITISYADFSHASFYTGNQQMTITGSTVNHPDTSAYNSIWGSAAYIESNKNPAQIKFPDGKNVILYYSANGQFRYSQYPLLQRIKVVDSVFRYGYMLNWDTTGYGANSRDFLSGINYYTNNAVKPGYTFTYNGPFFKIRGDTTDYMLNKRDHWGYYNAANNRREMFPTVSGIYTGANREPTSDAVASSLASVKDPAGGITYYAFENNDTYPYTPDLNTISLDVSGNTSNTFIVSRYLGDRTYVKVSAASGINRSGSCPISGPGQLMVSVTNLAGTVTYSTDTVDLYKLFYTGYADFSPITITGTFLIKTTLGSGTYTSASLPVYFQYYNQLAASGSAVLSGGIRIKQISHYDPFTSKYDTLATYRYVLPDGKSSGFLGVRPTYNYVYTSGQKVILASPTSDLNYSGGLSIGYSRVEVLKGSVARNLGKQIFEYTSVADMPYDISPGGYYYSPKFQNDWAYGLPKQTLVYDSANHLIQKTKNTFSFLLKKPLVDSLFQGYATTNNSSGTGAGVGSIYEWQYLPQSGLPQLAAVADTFYHPDASITVSTKAMEYDTNYNLKKVTVPYDLNKGLQLEERMYYAYDYTLGGVIGAIRDSALMFPVSKESWITGDANPRILSATITDYKGTGLVGQPPYRPLTTYRLQTNATVPASSIGVFNPAVLIRDTARILPQETYSFERKTLTKTQTKSERTGQYTCFIYETKTLRPVAQVANAQLSDAGYTSFETSAGDTWGLTSALRDTMHAITGKQSYDLSNGSVSKSGLNSALTYFITYWTQGSVSISGATTAVLSDTRNSWNYNTRKISGVTSVTVSGSGLIDELRLYPIDAAMTSTTYNANGLVTSVCDANNTIVYNEYDIVNRLKVVRNADKNVIKKFDYSDSVKIIDPTPWWSVIDTAVCEIDSVSQPTGRVMRMERDTNYNSESFLAYQFVFIRIDSTKCPPPTPHTPDCGSDPAVKLVNNVCETACIITTSSEWKKVTVDGSTVFRWVCKKHYKWSDNSVSAEWTEYHTTSCTTGSSCGPLEES